MIRLSDSEAILSKALEDLGHSWTKTASGWRDKAREDFQKEYLDEFDRAGRAAKQSMRGISELLKKAVRDCS
jgi:uncharacterized protein YukE